MKSVLALALALCSFTAIGSLTMYELLHNHDSCRRVDPAMLGFNTAELALMCSLFNVWNLRIVLALAPRRMSRDWHRL